ncbi:MAG: O-antigen ligase family protein [Candidatus Schekmanbacteria bacterium]|nr:O-antigen ligase family protein [Candidatus Schekmanbacteria bacterium]
MDTSPVYQLNYLNPTETSGKSDVSSVDRFEKTSLSVLVAAVICAIFLPYYPVKIFLGFSLGIFWTYLAFVRIDLAVCFFIFFMPILDLFPPDFFGITGINAQTIIVAILFLGVFSQKQPQENSRCDPLKIPVYLLVFFTLLSIFRMPSAYCSDVERLSVAKNWLIYVSLYFITLKSYDLHYSRRLLIFLLVTIGIIVILSLKDFFRIADYIERNRNGGGVIGDQPNLYGGFLAMYTPLFICSLYLKLPSKRHYLLLAGTGLCFLALFTTLSRGSWLACLASLLFLGLVKDKRLLLFMLLALVVILVHPPPAVEERVDDTFLEEGVQGKYENQQYDNSTELRLRQWKGLPRMMAEAPILGTGFETFQEVVVRCGVLPFPKAAHSSFIWIAVEEGIVGLILYLWILAAVFFSARQVMRQTDDPYIKALAGGLLGCVIALFLLDLSGARFFSNELTAYFWIMAGITVKAKGRLLTGRQKSVAQGFSPASGNTGFQPVSCASSLCYQRRKLDGKTKDSLYQHISGIGIYSAGDAGISQSGN